MQARTLLALLLPFITCGLQWLLWDVFVKPYVWFLFFPAAFFCAWLGGLRIALTSSFISGLLVWYFYIPPSFSFELPNAAAPASIVMFVLMGGMFGWVFERLKLAQQKTSEALKQAETAKAEALALYEKTLELDKLKSQFFANVSHELRTPLTLIMAPLEQRLQRAESADEHQHTEMMLRNARLLYRHVSDLLDASKLEAGRMQLHYARTDLVQLVRVCAANFDAVAQERKIEYQLNTPVSLQAELDTEKVERILINLLANAFKFTPDTGRIVITVSELAEQAYISVEDSGPGVPVVMRNKVFERFQQLEGSHGGTGLGLSIVKEFAQLHGGSAEVNIASIGGAAFVITLPLQAPAGLPISEEHCRLNPILLQQAQDDVMKLSPIYRTAQGDHLPLLLVVEDNSDMLAFISNALHQHYRVVTADNGKEGLAHALALHPDLILSDVMMPQMSGDEMVLAIRQHPELDGIPIVLLTAKADDALRVRMLAIGVQDYLPKPFSVDELLARVGGLVVERRRQLAQLAQSEKRFEITFEQAAVGLALLSPTGVLLRVNQHLCEILGCEMSRLLAADPWQLPYPDDRGVLQQGIQQLLSQQQEKLSLEIRLLHQAGDYVWVSLTVALVWTEQQADYFIVVLQDITERKHYHKTIERQVAERTAELMAANKELESFAYAVSHDLRAPLRAMSGFSQALQEDLAGRLQGDELEYLKQIEFASEKMSQLIDGVLTLSRSTRGELQRDQLDLSRLAEQCCQALIQAEPLRKVSYQIEPNMMVRGDARMLEVVLMNLLQNAWKYTGRTPAASVRVYSESVQGELRICVSDNGAGFDMKHSAHLFQPFQRLHRQDEFEGLGIGLATVQRIIHRHGGEISAQAMPGYGATFCFTLK